MTRGRNKIMLRVLVAIVFVGLLAFPITYTQLLHKSGTGGQNVTMESAIGNFGFYLEEVSNQSSVNFIHHPPKLDPLIDPILPQIASMGASVSVCDFDNDGWNDFYTTNSSFGYKNALFHNQRDGSFLDVAEKMGVANLNNESSGVSMGSVWGDYDNDGFEDLLVYKWGRPELFKNVQGESFINVTAESGLPVWANTNNAIWFDYNNDGYLDLFVGGYYREDIDLWHLKTTKILTESFEYSQNGGRNYLLKNLGNGTFADVTTETGLTSKRWTLAAGAVDINKDGYPELIIANDYGINEFYLNENGKTFIEQGDKVLIGLTPKSGMNVSFGDTYNKRQFGIYISNITEEGVLLQGNNFWVPIGGKNKALYENAAGKNGIEAGGWSYGAQFGDFNNDGFVDLYVANGYISGEKGTSYWYDYSKVTGGNTSIISDLKNWPDMKGRSQSGYQLNRIWLNEGFGHFRNVAQHVAGSQTYDSRAVALADLWNRGVLDVIVANQNNKLLMYKNHVDPENYWISFELEGIKSNSSAIGAIVELFWDSKEQSQVITGGIAFSSQNQKRVQFGLGKSSMVDKVVILWPSGNKQTIQNPEVGRINKITEQE